MLAQINSIFPQLQMARQHKHEDPKDFADRCSGLAQNLIPQIDDPAAQKMCNEQVERMLSVSYISGLTGTPRRQVRFALPAMMY
jgi:hypothetical protein